MFFSPEFIKATKKVPNRRNHPHRVFNGHLLEIPFHALLQKVIFLILSLLGYGGVIKILDYSYRNRMSRKFLAEFNGSKMIGIVPLSAPSQISRNEKQIQTFIPV